MNARKTNKRVKKLTFEEFYKFAKKVAKRDKWFIGGFLGAVWEEWHDKNKRVG